MSSKNEILLYETDASKIQLPPRNQNKKFEKATGTMKELDDALKTVIQIYKFNMAKLLATSSKLKDYFDGVIEKNTVSYLLNILTECGIITSQYTEVGGRTGRVYRIDGDHVQRVRGVYENHVRPKEKPEEQVDFVEGLILGK